MISDLKRLLKHKKYLKKKIVQFDYTKMKKLFIKRHYKNSKKSSHKQEKIICNSTYNYQSISITSYIKNSYKLIIKR